MEKPRKFFYRGYWVVDPFSKNIFITKKSGRWLIITIFSNLKIFYHFLGSSILSRSPILYQTLSWQKIWVWDHKLSQNVTDHQNLSFFYQNLSEFIRIVAYAGLLQMYFDHCTAVTIHLQQTSKCSHFISLNIFYLKNVSVVLDLTLIW